MLDSVTDCAAAHTGTVAISGSHGGLYPAAVASRADLRAVIFNDAGLGLDRAGVAGVAALDDVSMAAAAADCMSCEIGSATDMRAHGRISYANRTAETLGVQLGMSVGEAAERMTRANQPTARLAPVTEARQNRNLGAGARASLFDSASLVRAQDTGTIIVTGSHGGLIGGDPRRALKAIARLAVFNDAGFGKGRIGITRLPALDHMGVAAVTVSHETARIGDAMSAFSTGRISALNETARSLGAREGHPLREWLDTLPPDPT